VRNQKQTIRKIVGFLNNEDEEGGFWLPNIQRPFVWTEDQMCRLFDSILREYPISTLLIWKTTSALRRRKFIDNWNAGLGARLSDFFVPSNAKKKCLVLDGQQRLQSLFIGLKGSYEGRELHFNVLSGEVAAPDDVKYQFAFRDPSKEAYPWLLFKDLVFTTRKPSQVVADIERTLARPLTAAERPKVDEHLALINQTFKTDEVISYQELDSIDNPDLYSEDDVVEIFIRANSGGTRLGKSDLLFSLLAASWEEANDEMEDILEELNRFGFSFQRDFVLKTSLTLLDKGARYEVEKFRKPGVREEMEANWKRIVEALLDVLDFVRGKTFIKCDRAIPSYLTLIPLIYFRYHFPNAWSNARDRDSYLLRTLLTGAFSGTPDQLIDDCVTKIRETQSFDTKELFGIMRTRGRSLELTHDRFWQMGYGSDTVHLLFNLWYRDFNYTPAYESNFPQIDHIFPQSMLKTVKRENPSTGKRNLMRYPQAIRDQLANCMLLTEKENGAGGKGATEPKKWFADKSDAYLKMHLIPADRSLWELDRFEDFIIARKALISAKFADLLSSAGASA